VFGETAAEHGDHISAGENRGGRQAGCAVSDAPGKTARGEPIIDKASLLAT